MTERRRTKTEITASGSVATFWRLVGGRKNGNGLLYSALITIMGLRMNPFPFEAYAMWLAAALLGTSAIVAMEDKRAARDTMTRRSTDAPPANEGHP